jgi:hypothetical protein
VRERRATSTASRDPPTDRAMPYDVRWSDDALEQLAEIWLDTPDPPAVTAANAEIDRRLARDPWSQGESRAGTRRVLVERPLIVAYEIIEDDRKVIVLKVGRTEE